jgi:hypothetical protein
MDTQLKSINCMVCGTKMSVQKWASLNQKCDYCKRNSTNQNPALDKCKHLQQIINKLNFKLHSSGYYTKVYVNNNLIIEIRLYVNIGTSSQSDYFIDNIFITQQLSLSPKQLSTNLDIPDIIKSDIAELINKLDINTSHVSDTHIDQIICDNCGKLTYEWIHINNHIVCLDNKCMLISP